MSTIDPAVPPIAPSTPAIPAAPWAADAAAYFGDNQEAIAGFDRYMREKQQPYVTQLEESVKPARELWDDLNNEEKVEGTARDIIASIYADAPDVIAAYDAIFAETPPAETPPAAVTPDEIPEWAKPIVESHQQQRDREAAEAATADYNDFKAGLKESHSLTDDDIGLIDPFIAMSPSDADAAVAAYNAWKANFLAAHGVEPAPAPVVPTPPPVLGVEGVATPPLQTEYKSYNQLGDALKAYSARQAVSSTPPPVVG